MCDQLHTQTLKLITPAFQYLLTRTDICCQPPYVNRSLDLKSLQGVHEIRFQLSEVAETTSKSSLSIEEEECISTYFIICHATVEAASGKRKSHSGGNWHRFANKIQVSSN
jgi:hypothetical protein